MYNEECEKATLLATFTNIDPGTVLLVPVSLPPQPWLMACMHLQALQVEGCSLAVSWLECGFWLTAICVLNFSFPDRHSYSCVASLNRLLWICLILPSRVPLV